MNWIKLFRHDIRCGILRWRYLLILVLFCLPCFSGWIAIRNAGLEGTWGDYIMNCFKGIGPPLDMEGFEFPIQWFLVMGGGLFLNLDYPLNDLTRAGQQVIIRAMSKKSWYFSKCAWNLLSCAVYILLGMGMAFLFALFSGGGLVLTNTHAVTESALLIPGAGQLGMWSFLLVAVILPCLTITAFSMLQMTLCLVMKPILGALVCICLQIISLFVDSPLFIGNGAMVARSGVLIQGCQDPMLGILACLTVIGISMVVGVVRFQRMDHLRFEG